MKNFYTPSLLLESFKTFVRVFLKKFIKFSHKTGFISLVISFILRNSVCTCFLTIFLSYNCYYEKTSSEVKNITDEIDFDLPDGWEYIRLSSIAYLSSGFTPAATELNSIGKIPYFKVSDMNTVGNEKYLSFTAQYYTGNKIKKIFPCNTIVFPKNGGAFFSQFSLC